MQERQLVPQITQVVGLWDVNLRLHKNVIHTLTLFFFSLACLVAYVVYYQKSFLTFEVDLNSQCSAKTNCKIQFRLPYDLPSPVTLHYLLDDKHVHLQRDYYKQKNGKQLAGINLGDEDSLEKSPCWPFATNAQMQKTTSINGKMLQPDAVALPCGAQALLYYHDDYNLTNIDQGLQIVIDQSNLVSESYKQNYFQRWQSTQQPYEDIAWIDVEDEHFIVWMMEPADYYLHKLWGQVQGGTLLAGNYELSVNNVQGAELYASRKAVFSSINKNLGEKPIFLIIQTSIALTLACVSLGIMAWNKLYRIKN